MDTVLPFCRDVDDNDEADKVSIREESALEDEEASLVENVQRSYVHVHSKVLPVFC
jgi:hypothetical protein